MNFIFRSCTDQDDFPNMLSLARQFPEHNLHTLDLPYRLASWALDDPENTALWFDPGGRLLAWAVLQTPFWTIDLSVDPEFELELLPEVLAWMEHAMRRVKNGPYSRPSWYVAVFPGLADLRSGLESMDFICQSDVPDDAWSQVLMRTGLDHPIPVPVVPPGYTIRPLNGEAEVDDYVRLHRDVFGTWNMTGEWRSRCLIQPDYRPELDLVAVAPNGELAGFCITWFHSIGRTCDLDGNPRPAGQIEPAGVHVQHRRLGLGKALLYEAFRQLKRLGAEEAYVMTDNYRDSALSLYESVGFQVISDVLLYRLDVI